MLNQGVILSQKPVKRKLKRQLPRKLRKARVLNRKKMIQRIPLLPQNGPRLSPLAALPAGPLRRNTTVLHPLLPLAQIVMRIRGTRTVNWSS